MILVTYANSSGKVRGVYIVFDGSGMARIGHSEDVERRVREHQSGNGRKLRLFCVLYGATMADEAYLHRILRQYRIPGLHSWYNNCPELWDEIKMYSRRHQIDIIRLKPPQLELFDQQAA